MHNILMLTAVTNWIGRYDMSGTMLSAFYTLSHLIHTTIQKSRHFVHFSGKEIKA